jgi:hypothetical protein
LVLGADMYAHAMGECRRATLAFRAERCYKPLGSGKQLVERHDLGLDEVAPEQLK